MAIVLRTIEAVACAVVLVALGPVILLAHAATWLDRLARKPQREGSNSPSEKLRNLPAREQPSRKLRPLHSGQSASKSNTLGSTLAAVVAALLLAGCDAASHDPPPAEWQNPYAEDGGPADPPFAIPEEPARADPQALWNVVHNGQTIAQWYEIAADKSRGKLRREDAMLELGRAGEPGAMALIQLLGLSDADSLLDRADFGYASREVSPGFVRRHAAQNLGLMGTAGRAAAPKLADLLLHDESLDVRNEAVIALARTNADLPEAIDAIHQVLQGEPIELYASCLAALGALRPNDLQTLEAMQRMAAQDPYRYGTDNKGLAWLNAIQAAKSFLVNR